MSHASPFTWRYSTGAMILCAVRWYVRNALRYRDGEGEELMRARGVTVDPTAVFRGVQRYAPELDIHYWRYLRATKDSYRADETSITHQALALSLSGGRC